MELANQDRVLGVRIHSCLLRELLEQLRWDNLRRVLGNVPPRAAFGAVGWMAVEGTLGFCTERTASLVGCMR